MHISFSNVFEIYIRQTYTISLDILLPKILILILNGANGLREQVGSAYKIVLLMTGRYD
jgi:hypothetical protein